MLETLFDFLEENVTTIIMLYKNTKVRSPDGYTDYFDILAGVLQGDTLAPYLFIIWPDYRLRSSIDLLKENDFKLSKERSRRYSTQTITSADNADDIALLANIPAHLEFLLYNLERAGSGRGLHVNAHKTEYMCFNQRGGISTLKDSPLKLVDMCTYFRNIISSSNNDIDKRLGNWWTGIDSLSVIWKSDLTDKIKRSFFQAAVISIMIYKCPHGP